MKNKLIGLSLIAAGTYLMCFTFIAAVRFLNDKPFNLITTFYAAGIELLWVGIFAIGLTLIILGADKIDN